jgi:hypothetical protein
LNDEDHLNPLSQPLRPARLSAKKEKESFYVFNASWKPTVMDSASYFLYIHEREDGNWQWDYYAFWGPLIKVETYAQHDGEQLNGRAFYYAEAEDGQKQTIYPFLC